LILYKKKPRLGGVELNMAAMLDMAFQLLTFFILTFRPAPVEAEVALKLPPTLPITGDPVETAPGNITSSDPVKNLNSLVITVLSDDQGGIQHLAIGDAPVTGLGSLDRRLGEILKDPGSPFDQIIVQVGSHVSYEGVMQVVDVCMRQKLASGQPLAKLSFVEASERVKGQSSAW
jgi:biopolymer transport protein ExbD